MTRVKRGTTTHKKREKLLKQTKGFLWGRKSKTRAAKEALLHAYSHAFRARKEKKRTFRRLWNVRINAALHNNGTKYSSFIHALKQNKIALNRNVLSQMAQDHPETFAKLVKRVSKPQKEARESTPKNNTKEAKQPENRTQSSGTPDALGKEPANKD